MIVHIIQEQIKKTSIVNNGKHVILKLMVKYKQILFGIQTYLSQKYCPSCTLLSWVEEEGTL